tara:strand:+ start:40879 stop:41085 length:207 start_codon:yes stop_codon:yes gene_type:complete
MSAYLDGVKFREDIRQVRVAMLCSDLGEDNGGPNALCQAETLEALAFLDLARSSIAKAMIAIPPELAD